MNLKRKHVWLRRLMLSAAVFLCVSAYFLVDRDFLEPSIGLDEVIEFEIGRSNLQLPDIPCTMGAHRGASVQYLENSFPALMAACEDPKYAFIEFDVQYTADRQIVVFHDKRLLRIFRSFATIGGSSYEALLEMTDGQISLYGDVMDRVQKKLNIEIKSRGDDSEDRQLADEIIADLKNRDRLKDVMISSISGDVIRYIKDRYPQVPTGQIFWITSSTYLPFDSLTKRLYRIVDESKADYLLLNVANLRNIEDLLALQPKGKTIIFWDFDDRMYLVRHNWNDRLWGTTMLGDLWQRIVYKLI